MNDNSFKKLLLLLAGLILVLVVIILLAGKEKGQVTTPIEEGEISQKIIRKDIPQDQIPEGFVKEVPLEAGGKIVQNFSADTPDNRHQATRVFESAKTVEDNFSLYLNFFKTNNWIINGQTKSAALSSISASKDGREVIINIVKNSQTKIVTVEVNTLTVIAL